MKDLLPRFIPQNLAGTTPERYCLIAVVTALLTWISPALGAALMTPVFGPQQYTHASGHPQSFTNTFPHCGTALCRIVVVNGKADATKRISCDQDEDDRDHNDGDRERHRTDQDRDKGDHDGARGGRDRDDKHHGDGDDHHHSPEACGASIFLNGKDIISPNDFGKRVATIVRPVVLTNENQLVIKLASKRGTFLTVEVECLASTVVLSAGMPGVSLLNPTTLLSALPLVNSGTALAENVQVVSITLTGGTLVLPASLPLNLGNIPVGGSSILDADFSGGPFAPGGSYALAVQGTYAVGTATYCFTVNSQLKVPPAAPGSAMLTTTTVAGNQVIGGPFPPQVPSFDNDVNPPGPPVPTAPFVPGTRTPNGTGTQLAPRAFEAPKSRKAPQADPPAVVFVENNGLGINGSTIAEPSGGSSGGGVVFASANWFAAFSTDGGGTFTQVNPTTIFPNDIVGYCCDQVVQYVPSIDRFIWLLQGNGYRLASASPADIRKYNADGRAWTYWNLTPQVFGQPAGTGFDYPDMSVGDNSLYISWDAGFGCPGGCSQGFQVVRISLAQIQAGGTIGIGYTDPANGPSSITWGDHLMQDTGDEIFWAGHNGNAQLRVFSLAENSNTYFWRDIGISSWANNADLYGCIFILSIQECHNLRRPTGEVGRRKLGRPASPKQRSSSDTVGEAREGFIADPRHSPDNVLRLAGIIALPQIIGASNFASQALGKVLNVRWQEKSAPLQNEDSQGQAFTPPKQFLAAISAEHAGPDHNRVERVSPVALASGYLTPIVTDITAHDVITEVSLLNIVSCCYLTGD